ncbi:SDR family oxidoreductase [Micromonospora craniellae]|uniref:SDR family oxidoreductase n=1 Tax=Micromonospora craniellae TaxID=2294034 RepID=A0A372G165_9ACTN|nr:SDR family oxidoreductase [Micromonospora craniellae]RFS46801.1 SDR family oxidoreductase [Micromonospora craniellae]
MPVPGDTLKISPHRRERPVRVLVHVRVNAVAPGITRTDIHALSGQPDRPERAAGRIPLGRPGEPDEVAAAIAWLLGADASYTTGAVLRVGGGL